MATLGKYCRVYSVKRLREYPCWSEDLSQLRPTVADDGTTSARTRLTDEDYLFLQEDYSVTDGIFLDERIIFKQITNEWKQFCHTQLQFQLPAWMVPMNEPTAQPLQNATQDSSN